MKYDKVDSARLYVLVKVAQEKNMYSSVELGKAVSDIVKIVLSSDQFNGYSEDWQSEMFMDACLSVYKSFPNVDAGRGNLFNYFYTIALNSCKRTVKKLNSRASLPLDEENASGITSVALREKRKATRGMFEKNEENMIGRIKKMVLLKNAVNRAVETALDGIKVSNINALVRMARANREAIC